MGWGAGSEWEKQAANRWLEDVLHDLVKYLELMPRNMDWEDIDEDDLELLQEAIFETRVDRSGSRSARDIWAQALKALPSGLREPPVRKEVDAHLKVLEGFREALEDGDLDGIDVERLRAALFGIGDALRGLKSGP